jgi:hypothetical protein
MAQKTFQRSIHQSFSVLVDTALDQYGHCIQKYCPSDILHLVYQRFFSSRHSILSAHLRQRRLRLGQPERHVHGPIHLDGRGQRSAGLFPLSHRSIQHTQSPVTVGL